MIDVNNLVSCRPLKDTNEIVKDGDAEEIVYFQDLYDEAKIRSYSTVRELARV